MSKHFASILFSFCVLCTIVVSAQVRVEKRLYGKKITGIQKELNTDYFVVVGDWGRSGQGDSQAVADWMGIAANQLNARFVISTGDNFYCCGVASADDYQWITSFENVFRSQSLQIPWYVTVGNHDYQGSVQAQIDYGKKNQRWKFPNRYYTIRYKEIRFVFMDTNPFIKKYYDQPDSYPDLNQQDTLKQIAWMDSVLSNSEEERKIVVGHHPFYSVGEHGGERDMKTLERMLEKHNVRIYFAGHDHSLQSLHPKGSSVIHLVSGGGAEKTPVKIDPDITRFAKSTTGFMVVASNKKEFKVYFIDGSGKLIYTEIIPDDRAALDSWVEKK